MYMKRLRWMLLLVTLSTPLASSQDEEKIQKLRQDAIQSMGGDSYLDITDMISEGTYFVFNYEGQSSNLTKFDDYTKFPDKSRYEQGNNKNNRHVTVFNLGKNQGWILEGREGTREATPAEMKEFESAAKHSIDNILRFRYIDPANKLFYLGPGEGREFTFELVKLLDPENDEVVIYFDRLTKLPAKIQYWSVNNRGMRQRHDQEFSQWHVIQGVKTPLRFDYYINGRRDMQVFIAKVAYNNDLPDSFFSKPEPPK